MARLRDGAVLYLTAFFAWVAVLAVRWPIVPVDTDLWFHLNAGRYVASHAALPDRAFFSFLDPSPVWIDYSWLAQLGLYGTWSLFGDVGLVELRALCVLATLGLALAVLRTGRGRADLGASALAFTAVALALFPRFAAIRPHLASYLALALALYLLESRRALVALPLVALFWANLHGITYPVLWLVLGAYLVEWTAARFGLVRGVEPPGRVEVACVALAGLAVLLTPHGTALLGVPFTPLGLAPAYIDELRPVAPLALFSAGVDGGALLHPSARLALLALVLLAVASSLLERAPRPAPLLLVAGGAFLLLRMQRFGAEFALLALPMLRSFRLPALARPWLPPAARIAGLAVLAFVAFRSLAGLVDLRCGFPLCGRDLPAGVAAFLNRHAASGAVLNHPNDGGFLEWALHPRQPIFVDLQTPFLFPSEAIFAADQAFQDPLVLARVIERHRPAYLVAKRALPASAAVLASQPDFVAVFVDDTAVLYASRSRAPAVVQANALHALRPFTLEVAGDPALAEAELRRMNELRPGMVSTGIGEGRLALARGDPSRALALATEVGRVHPDRAEPDALRGDALVRQARHEDAIASYEEALGKLEPDDGEWSRLWRELWIAHARLGQHGDAWRAAQQALPDVFSPDVSGAELASLGGTALDAGELEQGRLLLGLARQKLPPDDARLRAWIDQRLGTGTGTFVD